MDQRVKLTSILTQRYIEKILPYEQIVDTLNLQNEEIYELEKKFLEIYESSKAINPIDENDRTLVKKREQEKIEQRKKFIIEALIEKQPSYKSQYEKNRNQLEQQISCLKQIIENQAGNSINIFMNLNEDILHNLMQQSRGNEQLSSNLKHWKQVYEKVKRSDEK